MVRRISHGKAAADEARKASLDAAGVAIPDFGKARGIIGAIDHGEKAIYHAKMAARQFARSKKQRIKGTLRNLLKLGRQQRRRRPTLKRGMRRPSGRRRW
jgi:hypothetical protein